MKKENIGRNISELKKELNEWMLRVEQDDVDEMLNFQSLIERNLLPVRNLGIIYFPSVVILF